MNVSPEELWAEFGPIVTDLAVNIISALILVVIGWSIAAWAHRAVRRGLGRFRNMDGTLVSVVAGVTRYFILVTVLVMVLGRFGVQTASILAALGAIGLAVGLALQGTLANIAAGVMLLVLRPFRIGDYVDANGNEGTVEDVGLFATEFTTYDGLYVSVPNSGIWGGRLLNYSRNPTRRHDIIIGVSYGDDIDRAQEILHGVIRSDPRVLPEPAEPQVLVRELGDSSVNLGMRFWTTGDDFWPVSFELRKAAKKALDEAGITIPFPQRDVHHFDHREVA